MTAISQTTTPGAPAARGAGTLAMVRLGARELRSGLSGFYVFIACLALGRDGDRGRRRARRRPDRRL